MTLDKAAAAAIDIGRKQAKEVLIYRSKALGRRARALRTRAKTLSAAKAGGPSKAAPKALSTAGVLVAEGDSWFDYPLHDILEILEDEHGYDVESVAHKGDSIEEMAYGSNQLEEFTRGIEKLLRRDAIPKAILLSGGGNDIGGDGFAMLVNHARSSIAGLNDQVVNGIIDERIQAAYISILAAVTQVCEQTVGKALPILVHGYDYPVPDGRGFLGGFGFLPGPWLEPGFREKGFDDIQRTRAAMHDLIDRFNAMVKRVSQLQAFKHVKYIDLRNTLSSGKDYKDWWANELHPTRKGFTRITDRFLAQLQAL